MNDFTGYVLAGGKSSRMGADKALLKIGDQTFLENAVGILEPICEQVRVVLNRSQTGLTEKIPDGVSRIFDRFENRGALGGVHAALADCQTTFAVILAVDLPFVTGEAIEKLCEIISHENDFSAVVPLQADGKTQPLCAVYRVKDCLPKAEKLLSQTASASMRDFLEIIEAKELPTDSFDQNLFANINSPTDYQILKGAIR